MDEKRELRPGDVDMAKPGPDGAVWVPPGVYETDGRSGILRRVGDLPDDQEGDGMNRRSTGS